MVRRSIPGQLGLFGDPVVGPATPEDRLEQLARALPENLRFGTSSWTFPGWEGIVYDRRADRKDLARRGLAAYARHPLLRAVGLDRTYYAPIPVGEYERYGEQVPDDFRFLVKVPAAVTSPDVPDSRFLDPTWAVDQAVGPAADGLGAKLGCLLFQFPPLGASVPRFAERLEEFLAALPSGVPYAVELRDRSLYDTDYLAALRRAGARPCYNVHPRMPGVAVQAAKAALEEGPLYVRWMLRGQMGYEEAKTRFDPFDRIVDEDVAARESVGKLCRDRIAHEAEVLVIANNKAEGSAPLTLFRLAEEIARTRGGDA